MCSIRCDSHGDEVRAGLEGAPSDLHAAEARCFFNKYKSLSAAVRIAQWYRYILVSGVSTYNISHHQLEYTLISGMDIYLCQAFRLLI